MTCFLVVVQDQRTGPCYEFHVILGGVKMLTRGHTEGQSQKTLGSWL